MNTGITVFASALFASRLPVHCVRLLLVLATLAAPTLVVLTLTTSTLAVQAMTFVADSTRPAERTERPVRYIFGRVWLSDSFSLYDAEDAGVELEHARIKQGMYVEAYFTDATLEALHRRGVQVDVLTADAERDNRERLARFAAARLLKKNHSTETAVAKNFKLGSFGGFYTLQELYGEFRRMKSLFPELITEPTTIGSTYEGRPIYAYRVGSPESLHENKPEVLYTALHHAREPGSAANLIYFLWTMFERYAAGDPEARYLLNNRQLHVVPVVNPDGYAYNEERNPSGGGMWRKNRRNNMDGSFGVDLNRNYGTQEFWDAPNGGSSEASGTDTYRGPAPFSEPETQAIRTLCQVRSFKTALNYHTFSNLLIYPYSYTNNETADSTYFRALCAEITKFNKYSGGRDLQTVGYAVRGASDDWMYAEVDGHGKIMAMTPEVGTVNDSFWPDPDRIAAQGLENLTTNLQTAWSASTNLRPVQVFTTENPQTGRTRITVETQNIGVTQAADEYTLSLRALVAGAEIFEPQRTLKRLRSTEVQREIFNIQTTDSMVRNGTRIPVEITIVQDSVPRRDTLEVQVYLPKRIPLFAGDATGWTLGRWGVQADALTGRFALTDSPLNTYRNSDRNYATYSKLIDLRGLRAATLEFQTRWSLEANYDFAVVQASSDGGATWKYLRSPMMKRGLDVFRGGQDPNGFGFDGNFPLWIRQECPLDEFLGKEILVRFGVVSDAGGSFDGLYVSDVAVRTYTDSPSFIHVPPAQVPELRVAPSVISSESEINLVLPSSFTAQTAGKSTINVLFFNALGQRAYEVNAEVFEGVATLRNPFLPSGVYIVVTTNGANIARKQVLIAK